MSDYNIGFGFITDEMISAILPHVQGKVLNDLQDRPTLRSEHLQDHQTQLDSRRGAGTLLRPRDIFQHRALARCPSPYSSSGSMVRWIHRGINNKFYLPGNTIIGFKVGWGTLGDIINHIAFAGNTTGRGVHLLASQ